MNVESVKPEVVINGFEEGEINGYINTIDTIIESYGEQIPILLTIDSFGGAIYGLCRLYEYLKSINNPIVTYCNSKAMSAGAILLAVAAPKGNRFCSPNASIMIHELQSMTMGDIKDIASSATMLANENEKWMELLAQAMGLKSAKEVRSLILKNEGHELYLSAKQAKKLGIIDYISYLRYTKDVSYRIATSNNKENKR